MYEVHLLNIEKNIEFVKVFNDKRKLKAFVNKVRFSKKLKLLMIVNNEYLYE